MKLFKGLIILAVLSGFTVQTKASDKKDKPKSESTWILGDIIIKRPPISDDGPGGNGGKGGN